MMKNRCCSIAVRSLCLLSVVAVNASYNPRQPIAVSPKSGRAKVTQQRLETPQALAALEQEVEDYNAQWVATAPDAVTSCSKRRLICLPLDERFDPPMGVFSHGHVQTGDKISVPRIFWQAIQISHAEVCPIAHTRISCVHYAKNATTHCMIVLMITGSLVDGSVSRGRGHERKGGGII